VKDERKEIYFEILKESFQRWGGASYAPRVWAEAQREKGLFTSL
jgi:hypothetical protein